MVTVNSKKFGSTKDGREVTAFELSNDDECAYFMSKVNRK